MQILGKPLLVRCKELSQHQDRCLKYRETNGHVVWKWDHLLLQAWTARNSSILPSDTTPRTSGRRGRRSICFHPIHIKFPGPDTLGMMKVFQKKKGIRSHSPPKKLP